MGTAWGYTSTEPSKLGASVGRARKRPVNGSAAKDGKSLLLFPYKPDFLTF